MSKSAKEFYLETESEHYDDNCPYWFEWMKAYAQYRLDLQRESYLNIIDTLEKEIEQLKSCLWIARDELLDNGFSIESGLIKKINELLK